MENSIVHFDRLEEGFRALGAKVSTRIVDLPRWRREHSPEITIDVEEGPRGEVFEFRLQRGVRAELEIIDLRPELRHLLLLRRTPEGKEKFLCGHDERHWFVAAVPESATWVRSVETAWEALRPEPMRERCARGRIRKRRRYHRRNEAYVRQGEWFFVPVPDLDPDPLTILRNEPLSRGPGSKPHRLEFCFRRGGEIVWVSPRHPRSLTVSEFHHLRRRDPHEMRTADWTQRVRDPEVYARGTVTHADHATIRLRGWHRVHMNTEPQARAGRLVEFLD